MELTPKIERLMDGCYRATTIEMPGIFYVGRECEVRERMSNLLHAVRSPHILIEKIMPDGDVILTLSRHEGQILPFPTPRKTLLAG